MTRANGSSPKAEDAGVVDGHLAMGEQDDRQRLSEHDESRRDRQQGYRREPGAEAEIADHLVVLLACCRSRKPGHQCRQ
jgi:hypothetical protein